MFISAEKGERGNPVISGERKEKAPILIVGEGRRRGGSRKTKLPPFYWHEKEGEKKKMVVYRQKGRGRKKVDGKREGCFSLTLPKEKRKKKES